MSSETKRKLKIRLKLIKLMFVLIIAFPLPLIFGLKKSYGSSVKQEYIEYAECWHCLCIMLYFGEEMTKGELERHLNERLGEHL